MLVGVEGFGKLGSMLHRPITSVAFEESTETCERCGVHCDILGVMKECNDTLN